LVCAQRFINRALQARLKKGKNDGGGGKEEKCLGASMKVRRWQEKGKLKKIKKEGGTASHIMEANGQEVSKGRNGWQGRLNHENLYRALNLHTKGFHQF